MASQDPQRKSQEDVLCPSALKHTLDAMFVIDSFGKILAASDSVEKVFGWTPEELVGQNSVVVMAEPYQSHHDEYLANYRRTGKTVLIGQPREFEALRKDGTKLGFLELGDVDERNDRTCDGVFAGMVWQYSHQEVDAGAVSDFPFDWRRGIDHLLGVFEQSGMRRP